MVDVGGVGYLVAVPLSTYATLGELHTEVTLLIHTHGDTPATKSPSARHMAELAKQTSHTG